MRTDNIKTLIIGILLVLLLLLLRLSMKLAFGSVSEYMSGSKTGGHSMFGYSVVETEFNEVFEGDVTVKSITFALDGFVGGGGAVTSGAVSMALVEIDEAVEYLRLFVDWLGNITCEKISSS